MTKFLTPVLLLAILPLFCFSQQSASSLPDSTYTHPPASCSVCAGAMWDNESNAKLFDNQYAETELMPYLFCFQTLCYRSRYMAANNFEFAIPANATVTSIEVGVSGFSSHPYAVYDSTIRLTKNYAMVGANTPDSAAWHTQDQNRTYGVGLGLWGETWTPTEINDPGFGVFYKVYNTSDSSPIFKLDVIRITVYYSTPQGTSSQTSTPKKFTSVYDPSSDQIAVNFEPGTPGQQYRLEVLNVSGTVVHSEQIGDVSLFETRIQAITFAPGVYFVRMVSNEDQHVKRLIISP